MGTLSLSPNIIKPPNMNIQNPKDLHINNDINKVSDFSGTEIALMEWLTCEWSNKEIARALPASIGTVKRMKKQLCRKTGSRYYVGIVVFAIKNGFVKI